MKYDKVIVFKVSAKVKEKIEKLAEKDGRSVSNYIRLILEKSTK